MKKIVILLSLFSLLTTTIFAQNIATNLNDFGDIPTDYKAFVMVNKYGFVMAPKPFKYVKGEPCPAVIMLSCKSLADLVYGGSQHSHRLFKVVLAGEESAKGLFVPSDDEKLVFSELKFVQVDRKIQWMIHPLSDDGKYCSVISNYNHNLLAGTDKDGNLIQGRSRDDGFEWEFIRVK